jgi:hypothetical protein
VPFEVIPFKENTGAARPAALKRHRVSRGHVTCEEARYG